MTVILHPEYAVAGVNDVMEGGETVVKVEILRGSGYDAMVIVTDDAPIRVPVPMMSDILVSLIKTHDEAAVEGPETRDLTKATHDEPASKFDPDIVI